MFDLFEEDESPDEQEANKEAPPNS